MKVTAKEVIDDSRPFRSSNLKAAMDWEEAQEAELTKEQVFEEIQAHGHDPADFVAEVGDKPTYIGAEVLSWLGY